MHLTVRMAWHDNNWDGKVCRDPESNTYCSGAHSLLSGRIEKRKDVELETKNRGRLIEGNFSLDSVPPCYWSINAFGSKGFNIEHRHAFRAVKETIPDYVEPYSVMTWPFKLSFVHNTKNSNKFGNYPPDLESRIENYLDKFTSGSSIIFFYANYDNPVSADDMRYLLIGCSVVKGKPKTTKFDFDPDWLKNFRKQSKTLKNFPEINWAIQFHHDPDQSVLLPYKEYIEYVENNPEDEDKLNDMKVIIEEESLIAGFKYVSMDIDDDKCLYLLYKLRKSILKIQEHAQAVVKSELKEEEERITELITTVWEKRGIYPSLNLVLNNFLDDRQLSDDLSQALISISSHKRDLWKIFDEILEEEIPEELEGFEDDLLDLIDIRLFKKNYKSLIKLSLFNLTQYQIDTIIEDSALLKEIEHNPYVLYEEYTDSESDLDIPDLQDEPIDVYKIDIGMIPDRKFVKRHRKLQDLGEDSAERIRSVIINYLWAIGAHGHCYDHSRNILHDIKEHPLIYKTQATIDEDAILNLDSDYKSHFIEKLNIREVDEERYYYLQPIKKTEEHIKEIIQKLVSKRGDHKIAVFDHADHIEKGLKELKKVLKSEEEKQQFKVERRSLFENIFSKSFFLLTGKPGSGKTHEISKVIEHLNKLNEDILVLAPTGKAALRITENIKKNTKIDLEAQTIDRFIYDKEFGWAYEDFERLENLTERDKLTVENLIIDESSMIDLIKLKVLFSIIKFNEKYPKRLILVGDENQLPPIGFGKPFHDIIDFILANEILANKHYIFLKSNCRQENDENILKLAEAFTNKKRYYEEAIEIIQTDKDIQVSDGLYVKKWHNKDELSNKLIDSTNDLLEIELGSAYQDLQSDEKRLNRFFGLYDNGHVNNKEYKFRDRLKLEDLQILSPYRTSHFGTVNTNKLIQKNYRTIQEYKSESRVFIHSDKLIRISNWYKGWGETRRLILSNGSIGVFNESFKKKRYYFKELEYPQKKIDSEDNFDLAYCITIHKSQGSDFKNVFLVIPNKLTLLSKELIYTALTRSKFRLFLFVQETEENLLEIAKNVSHLQNRNSSIFKDPLDYRQKYIPEPGKKPVRSRIEYIIHQSLKNSGLDFEYEKRLDLTKRDYVIHPDFTINLKDGRQVFWEHLGMLDVRKYYKDWQRRKKDYEDHDLFNSVITTDDLDGINQEKIDLLIEHIREGKLAKSDGSKFSNYHYELY